MFFFTPIDISLIRRKIVLYDKGFFKTNLRAFLLRKTIDKNGIPGWMNISGMIRVSPSCAPR